MAYNIGYPNETDSYITNPPIEQGSTFELPFTVTLPAAIMEYFTTPKTVSIRASYRTSLSAPTKVDFDGASVKAISATVLDCKLTMDSDTTAGLTAGNGFWDCEIYNNDTPPYVLKPFGAGNKCKVKGEATR